MNNDIYKNLCLIIHDDEDYFLWCDSYDSKDVIADCFHEYNWFYYLALEKELWQIAFEFAKFRYPYHMMRILKNYKFENEDQQFVIDTLIECDKLWKIQTSSEIK